MSSERGSAAGEVQNDSQAGTALETVSPTHEWDPPAGENLADDQQQYVDQEETTEPGDAISSSGQLSQPGGAAPGAASNADAGKSSCDKAAKQLSSFYRHLDAQPYMRQYGLTDSSRNHFDALIRKLLANPPQVTREADDLYAILKNTAHFFRVCGKENILMLKGILDNEKNSLEQILADYHHLVTTADCSKSSYGADIDAGPLYEYACFFLNTMGGRLYLFRRDVLSRMVVTYYAIMVIDQANEKNNNHHGINLKPAVDMLIAEMEAGGGALQRGEFYLDNLYDLKEKYQDQ